MSVDVSGALGRPTAVCLLVRTRLPMTARAGGSTAPIAVSARPRTGRRDEAERG
jgi:hypothetical protein